MPSARYSLGATVCPDDPIWRSMGSHPESQIGRDAARSPPRASANCHDDLRLREVDGLFGFLEDFLRLVADDAISDVDIHGFDRCRAGSGFGLVSAESTVLKRDEPGSVAGETYVGREL